MLHALENGGCCVGSHGIMQATGVNGDPGIDLPEDVMWNWRRSVDVVIAEIRNIHLPNATALINDLANTYRVQDGWPDIHIGSSGIGGEYFLAKRKASGKS